MLPARHGVRMLAPLSYRRFYATVRVAAKENRLFAVLLDDRPLHTPDGVLLAVPSRPLADAIAAEWQAQGVRIDPATLPLTQLANTAIDQIAVVRQQQVLDALLAFAATDLVCYRAATPQALTERQQNQWQPLLDWVARRYGAKLEITVGVMPVPQSSAALAALRVALTEMDSLCLAALYRTATLCGSLVVALALIQGEIDAGVAFAAAQLDVLFQAEYWGVNATTTAHQDILYAELHILTRFVTLLEPMPPRTT